jgi:serine/threonine protein kinase
VQEQVAAAESATQIFGKYDIIRRLAIGGMGEIFLTRQIGIAGFDRLVILKRLLPDLASDDVFVQQFLDEARVVATLNHPNIVGIHEVGYWGGSYFIAMEYIHGTSLDELVTETRRAEKRILPQVAAKIIHDAALGLDHAHRARDTQGRPLNIVHRDISPQNIMVREDGVTKVVDFGIAKAANKTVRTNTGTLKGKLQYMASEQIAGEVLDGRCDQFALGVVFWELVTGRHLFRGENAYQTMVLVTENKVPLPTTLVEGFPQPLEDIIMRMLQRDRANRFATCHDVADALRLFFDSESKKTGEEQVGEAVRALAGKKIDQVTRDLTPSKENFFIALREQPQELSSADVLGNNARTISESVDSPALARAERRWPKYAVLAAAIAVTAVAAPLVWLRVAPKPLVVEAPPVVALAAPPVVAAAPPVVAAPEPPPQKAQAPPPPAQPEHTARHAAGGAKKPLALAVATKTVLDDGSLTLQTTPWTQVYVDGDPQGSTPLFKLKLKAGKHVLHLVNEQAGIDTTRTVSIAPDANQKLNWQLP